MTKKYKLLKDLPGINKGSIWKSKGWFYEPERYFEDMIPPRCSAHFVEFSDFFEPLNEKWKPKEGEKYWYVNSTGLVIETVSLATHGKGEINFGNCFPTKQAAQEMRDKIKELLGKEK